MDVNSIFEIIFHCLPPTFNTVLVDQAGLPGSRSEGLATLANAGIFGFVDPVVLILISEFMISISGFFEFSSWFVDELVASTDDDDEDCLDPDPAPTGTGISS